MILKRSSGRLNADLSQKKLLSLLPKKTELEPGLKTERRRVNPPHLVAIAYEWIYRADTTKCQLPFFSFLSPKCMDPKTNRAVHINPSLMKSVFKDAWQCSHSLPPIPGLQLRGRDRGPWPAWTRPWEPKCELSQARQEVTAEPRPGQPPRKEHRECAATVATEPQAHGRRPRAADSRLRHPAAPSPDLQVTHGVLAFLLHARSHTRYSIMFSFSNHPVFSVACSQRAFGSARSPTITQSWKFSYPLCTPLQSSTPVSIETNKTFSEI